MTCQVFTPAERPMTLQQFSQVRGGSRWLLTSEVRQIDGYAQ